MSRQLAVSLSLVFGALVSSCFSETPSGGGEGGTTGEPCMPQTLGCPCADGACDAGLACESSIALCIDPSCTPGTELCTCVDGSGCLAGLACDGGLCRVPPAPGEDTSGGVATTPPPGTTSPADDGETVPSDADVTTAGDTVEPVTTGITGTEDGDPTNPPDCQALPCAECYACQAEVGACMMAADVCAGAPQCTALADCTFPCLQGTVGCVEECCGTLDTGNSVQYAALAACAENACPGCDLDLSCPI